MTSKPLAEIFQLAETWPRHLQDELAAFARELDAGANGEVYDPTPEELAGIDRGLRAADAGRFASAADVEAVFAKFRGRRRSSTQAMR